MRAYVITTGCVFAAIVLAHLARLMAEGVGVVMGPVFIVTTLLACGLTAWAWVLLRKLRLTTGDERG